MVREFLNTLCFLMIGKYIFETTDKTVRLPKKELADLPNYSRIFITDFDHCDRPICKMITWYKGHDLNEFLLVDFLIKHNLKLAKGIYQVQCLQKGIHLEKDKQSFYYLKPNRNPLSLLSLEGADLQKLHYKRFYPYEPLYFYFFIFTSNKYRSPR